MNLQKGSVGTPPGILEKKKQKYINPYHQSPKSKVVTK